MSEERPARRGYTSCLIVALALGACLYAAVAPTLVPGRVRRSIQPGMSLRQVLEQNRERLRCGIEVTCIPAGADAAPVGSQAFVLARGRVWREASHLTLPGDVLRQRRSFAESLDALDAGIAAITTGAGWRVTLSYSPHVDVYQHVRFTLDPSGRVRSVDPE